MFGLVMPLHQSWRTDFLLSPTFRFAALFALCLSTVVAVPTSFAQVDPGSGGRRLADGVLHVIPSALNARDTFSLPAPMNGIDAKQWQPKLLSDKETLYGLSQRVVFFRDVWEYEFAFTGLRQAKINIEGVGNQNVWYMVYRVRNLGTSLTFEDVKKNPEFEHLSKDLRRNQPVEGKSFRPRLSLEGWVFDDLSRKYSKAVYPDEINPISGDGDSAPRRH